MAALACGWRPCHECLCQLHTPLRLAPLLISAALRSQPTQAIRAHRLLERLPAAAFGALAAHLVTDAEGQHRDLTRSFESARAASVQLLESHKRRLHPEMLNPAHRSDLEELGSREVERQRAAAALTDRCVGVVFWVCGALMRSSKRP